MSISSRRSARHFPGVRLNFGRSGVSTSVGMRNAGTASGSTGAHENPGASGTVLSYRSALAGRQPPPRERGSGYAFEQWTPPQSPPTDEIVSEELEELTAPGLDDLKGLIDEAAARRAEIAGEIARAQLALARAKSRLTFARAFIVRLLTVDNIPDLAREVDTAARNLAEQQAELDACFVEVDFGFDAAATASYAQLVQTFEALAGCDAIWDITAKARTNALTRTRVRFSLSGSDLVKCRHRVGRMENVAGRDIYLFPGFVMIREDADEFALVEYQELDVGLSTSQFIEEEEAPADAEFIGEDGIVFYGEMLLRTPSGLDEAYVVSSYARATDFVIALDNHREALAALQAQGGVPAPESPAAAVDVDRPLRVKFAKPTPVDIRPRSFVADWATLALLLVGLTWGVLHKPAPPPAPPPAAPTTAVAKAAPPPVAKKQAAQKPVRKRPSNARSAANGERRAAPAASANTPACSKIRATINPDAVTCY